MGQGRRFGTTRGSFSTASVSRPSASATAGLFSAISGSSQPIRSPRRCGALNVGGNSSDAAPPSISRQVTTYSNAAIASTTAARIGPASATSGRSCALTAPTHCPMITNLEISPRTSTRNLCVRNFVQSHHRSNICTAADRTEVPRLTCDYPRTRTGIATAHRSMTLKTVTSIITHECNFRGGIT